MGGCSRPQSLGSYRQKGRIDEHFNFSAYTPHTNIPVDLLTPRSSSGFVQQRRALHFTAQRSASGDPSKAPSPDSYEARRQIPTSSWARPHKPSQDADDNVVPSYYVERKRQRSEIAERKEEEGSEHQAECRLRPFIHGPLYASTNILIRYARPYSRRRSLVSRALRSVQTRSRPACNGEIMLLGIEQSPRLSTTNTSLRMGRI